MAKKKHKKSQGRLNSVTACISTTMVLVLVGIVVFFGAMADNLSRSVKENFTVEVLLEDSLDTHATRVLQKELTAKPYTKAVNYISKEKATRTMAEAFDTNPEEFVGNSPFPASFELHLHADYANADSLSRFMPAIEKRAGVMEVIYPEDLMTQVNHNIQQIAIVLMIIAALLSIVSIALINNTVRLNVARRRHSIQTMKLVGASWGFIRRPFVLSAVGMGVLASLLADATLFGGIYTLMQWDAEIAALITPLILVVTMGSVLVFGVVLTLTSSFFSVNHHLNMSREEAELY